MSCLFNLERQKKKQQDRGHQVGFPPAHGISLLSSCVLLSSLPSFYLKLPPTPANAVFPLSTLGEYLARMIVDEVGNERRESKQGRKCVGKAEKRG
jgi:hypothetical protein